MVLFDGLNACYFMDIMVADEKWKSMSQFESFILDCLESLELIVGNGDPGWYCIFQ